MASWNRKRHILGSQDHDISRTVCGRQFVRLFAIQLCSFCKIQEGISTLLGLPGDYQCSLASLRWMNLCILFCSGVVMYAIMRVANPENVSVVHCM